VNTHFSFDDDIDLSRFDSLYRMSAPAEAASISYNVPDGRYEVVIAQATLTRSQRSGNPMIRYVLRITGSTFRDRILRKHAAVTENTIRFVRKELETCGLTLKNFSDLNHRIGELEGVELEIVKVTKGEDSNIYFNRLISGQAQPAVTADDLPF
jgi:hypothetical protein